MKNLLLLLHLYSVIIWIGGMFFAHFCLRPVAIAQLPPPQRLPLLAAVLGRFFAVVSVSVALILASGLALLMTTGLAHAPAFVHPMLGGGLLMAVIFGYLRFAPFVRLRAAVAAQQWPQAGAEMNRIRIGVLINLALGGVIVGIYRLLA